MPAGEVGVGCEVGETVAIAGPSVGIDVTGVGEMSAGEGDVPTKVEQPASDAQSAIATTLTTCIPR